jgi:protein-disulfide isomerase
MKQKTVFVVAAATLVLAFLVGAWVYKSGEADRSAKLADPTHTRLVRMHSPTLGKPDAKVELVEFLDPACGACAAFHPSVKKLLAEYPDQIRLVVRYAPFHKGSGKVVTVLEAAKKQGKFWPALEALLNSQADWTRNHVAHVDLVWKHLEGLGLNFEQARADMKAPAMMRTIAQDLDDAKALNVNRTPSFFVNGQPLQGFGYEPLKAMVDNALRSAQR